MLTMSGGPIRPTRPAETQPDLDQNLPRNLIHSMKHDNDNQRHELDNETINISNEPQTAEDYRKMLESCTDGTINIVNITDAIIILDKLERYEMKKEELFQSRLGKYINTLRKNTCNVMIAKKAKNLVRSWQKLIPVAQKDLNNSKIQKIGNKATNFNINKITSANIDDIINNNNFNNKNNVYDFKSLNMTDISETSIKCTLDNESLIKFGDFLASNATKKPKTLETNFPVPSATSTPPKESKNEYGINNDRCDDMNYLETKSEKIISPNVNYELKNTNLSQNNLSYMPKKLYIEQVLHQINQKIDSLFVMIDDKNRNWNKIGDLIKTTKNDQKFQTNEHIGNIDKSNVILWPKNLNICTKLENADKDHSIDVLHENLVVFPFVCDILESSEI